MFDFIEALQQVSLFKGCSFENAEDLFVKRQYEICQYKKGNVIYFQNEKCETLDIILKGTLSIEGIDDSGDYVRISDFNTGHVIGGNLLFAHENTYPMTILAKTDIILLCLKKDMVLRLCQSDSSFLINFLESLSDKTVILADRIRTLSFKSLRKNITSFLIQESNRQNSNKVTLSLTKKELAERFGVQRTSLSRELNKMKEEKIIAYDIYSITIIDKEALMK